MQSAERVPIRGRARDGVRINGMQGAGRERVPIPGRAGDGVRDQPLVPRAFVPACFHRPVCFVTPGVVRHSGVLVVGALRSLSRSASSPPAPSSPRPFRHPRPLRHPGESRDPVRTSTPIHAIPVEPGRTRRRAHVIPAWATLPAPPATRRCTPGVAGAGAVPVRGRGGPGVAGGGAETGGPVPGRVGLTGRAGSGSVRRGHAAVRELADRFRDALELTGRAGSGSVRGHGAGGGRTGVMISRSVPAVGLGDWCREITRQRWRKVTPVVDRAIGVAADAGINRYHCTSTGVIGEVIEAQPRRRTNSRRACRPRAFPGPADVRCRCRQGACPVATATRGAW